MDKGNMLGRRRAAGLAAAFAGTALIGGKAAHAALNEPAASLSKTAVSYRDIPCNGRVCAQCVFFLFKPAAGSEPASACQMVAGIISPAGWCDIWAPKA